MVRTPEPKAVFQNNSTIKTATANAVAVFVDGFNGQEGLLVGLFSGMKHPLMPL